MKIPALVFFCVLTSVPATAALFDRGNGLIYDNILDVTWLQDANAGGQLDWFGAHSWVANLDYQGYDDWRLGSWSTCTL